MKRSKEANPSFTSEFRSNLVPSLLAGTIAGGLGGSALEHNIYDISSYEHGVKEIKAIKNDIVSLKLHETHAFEQGNKDAAAFLASEVATDQNHIKSVQANLPPQPGDFESGLYPCGGVVVGIIAVSALTTAIRRRFSGSNQLQQA